MGVLLGIEDGQKVCLEGDTDSEGKVKKVLQLIREALFRAARHSSWGPHKRHPRQDSGGGR